MAAYEERLFETPSDERQGPIMSDEVCLFYDNCQLFVNFQIHHYFSIFFSTGELVPNPKIQLHSSSVMQDIPLRLSNLFSGPVGVYGVLVAPQDSTILEAALPERLVVIPANAKDVRFGVLKCKRTPHFKLGQSSYSTHVTVLTNMTNVNISVSWFSGYLELTHPSKQESLNGTWLVNVMESNARLSFKNSNPHQILLLDAYIVEVESGRKLSLLSDSFWLDEDFNDHNFQTDKSRMIRPGKEHDIVLNVGALRAQFMQSNSTELLLLKLCLHTDYENGCGYINLYAQEKKHLAVSPNKLTLGISETQMLHVHSSHCFEVKKPPEIQITSSNCSHFSASMKLESGFTVGSIEGRILFKLLRELKQKNEYRTTRAIYDRLIYHSMMIVKRFRESANQFSKDLDLRVISGSEEALVPCSLYCLSIANGVRILLQNTLQSKSIRFVPVLLSSVLRETLEPGQVYSEEILFLGLRNLYERILPEANFQTPAPVGRGNPCPDCGSFSFEGHLETFTLRGKEWRNLTVLYNQGEAPLRYEDMDILLIFNNFTILEVALLRVPLRETLLELKVDAHVAYSYSITRKDNHSFIHSLCTMFQSSPNPVFLPIERIVERPVEFLREIIPEEVSPLSYETSYDHPDAMISFTLTPKFSVHPISTSSREFPWITPFCYLEEKLFLKTGLPFDQICFSPADHASIGDRSEATIYNNMVQNHQIDIKATGDGEVVVDSVFLTHSEEQRSSTFSQYMDTYIIDTAPERWWKETMTPLTSDSKHTSYMELWRQIFQGQEPLCSKLLSVDQRHQLFPRDPPLRNQGYHLRDFEHAQCDMFGLALMNCFVPGGPEQKVLKPGESMKLYLRYEPDLVRYSFKAQLHIRAFINITEGLIPLKLRPIVLSVDYPKDVLEKASTIFQRDTIEFDFWIFFCLVSMLSLVLVVVCAAGDALFRHHRHTSIFRERYLQQPKPKFHFKLYNFIRTCLQKFKACINRAKNYFRKCREENERRRKRSVQLEKSKLVPLHQKKCKKQRRVPQSLIKKKKEKAKEVEEESQEVVEVEEDERVQVVEEDKKEEKEQLDDDEEEEETPEWCVESSGSESNQDILDSMVRGAEELSRELTPPEEKEDEIEEAPEWADSSEVESDQDLLDSMVQGAETLSHQLREEMNFHEMEFVPQTQEVLYNRCIPPERPAYFCGPGISSSMEELWKPLEESCTYYATVC
ncbi:hypothetical protein Ciccas_009674, partial [Cichlidogyrus casuarinus]